MIKKILFASLILSTSVYSQNVRTGGLIDLVYMSDSLTFDSKRFGLGGNISANHLNIFSSSNAFSNKNSNLYNLSFSRYYIPAENNRHNFILMNSLSVGIGEKDLNYRNNEIDLNLLNYKRERGIGYSFSDFTVIPFTSRGSLSYNFEGESFSGRTREFGVNLNVLNFVGLSLSYNNTIFESSSNLLEKYISRGFESVGNRYLNIGLAEFLPNNKLYPIYYWAANIAYNILYTSLYRNNYNFPFNHTKKFEVSSYNLSMRFELSLFQ